LGRIVADSLNVNSLPDLLWHPAACRPLDIHSVGKASQSVCSPPFAQNSSNPDVSIGLFLRMNPRPAPRPGGEWAPSRMERPDGTGLSDRAYALVAARPSLGSSEARFLNSLPVLLLIQKRIP
jgi:hypothetical protein